jgi:hypothetical protein
MSLRSQPTRDPGPSVRMWHVVSGFSPPFRDQYRGQWVDVQRIRHFEMSVLSSEDGGWAKRDGLLTYEMFLALFQCLHETTRLVFVGRGARFFISPRFEGVDKLQDSGRSEA